MDVQLLEYSFHSSKSKSGPANLPISSIDFHPQDSSIFLTSGFDAKIMIWSLCETPDCKIGIGLIKEVTTLEEKVVNCVRFSQSGDFIASGNDGGVLRIWDYKQLVNIKESNSFALSNCSKSLQNDTFSISDVAWCSDHFLVTVSMAVAGSQSAGRCIFWDVTNKCVLKIIDEKYKGFLQGCCVDPFFKYITVQDASRCAKVYEIRYGSKNPAKIKNITKIKSLHKGNHFIFRAENATLFTRRCNWSPDGLICCMTAGALSSDEKQNAALLFLRGFFEEPISMIPVDDVVIGCRWSPIFYEIIRNQTEPKLYPIKTTSIELNNKELLQEHISKTGDLSKFAPESGSGKYILQQPKQSAILYRQLLIILTKRSAYLCDSHNKHPIAVLRNIHLSTLTDASFSKDGMSILLSSHDGYVSHIKLNEKVIGRALSELEVNKYDHLKKLKEHQKRFIEGNSTSQNAQVTMNKENHPNILNIRR